MALPINVDKFAVSVFLSIFIGEAIYREAFIFFYLLPEFLHGGFSR